MRCRQSYLNGSIRYNRYPGTKEEAERWFREADWQEGIAAEQAEKEAERKLLVTAQKLEKARAKAARKPNNDKGCSNVATTPQNSGAGQKEEMTE